MEERGIDDGEWLAALNNVQGHQPSGTLGTGALEHDLVLRLASTALSPEKQRPFAAGWLQRGARVLPPWQGGGEAAGGPRGSTEGT
jgi:hypothetical protein